MHLHVFVAKYLVIHHVEPCRYLWGDLGDANGISLTIRRDKADSSSATVARKRPDLAVYVGNALVLKGEEKESSDELNAAVSELLSKTAKCAQLFWRYPS